MLSLQNFLNVFLQQRFLHFTKHINEIYESQIVLEKSLQKLWSTRIASTRTRNRK